MPEIPEITSPNIQIGEINIRDIPSVVQPYTSLPFSPPVVVNIGVPVVDIPGCVEAHETNNPKNNQIKSDDPDGLVTYCDSGIPSFNPIQFEPEQMIMTSPAPIPKSKTDPPKPEIPETSDVTPPPVNTATVDCPSPKQAEEQPVGTYLNGYKDIVTEYKLVGNECIQYTEKVPLPKQIVAGLPDGGQVVQVGGVAVIATTSALLAKPLADLLLKAVKPAVKKVLKKVASIRGKTLPVQSVGERRAEQRQMNHAVKSLRSVFPRKTKKKKE